MRNSSNILNYYLLGEYFVRSYYFIFVLFKLFYIVVGVCRIMCCVAY